MNEEEKEQFEKLVKSVGNLQEFKKSLESFDTIPKNIDDAWRERFGDILGLEISTKNKDSEDQAVDEAGGATYRVPKEYDGFVKTTIAGQTVQIGYYD